MMFQNKKKMFVNMVNNICTVLTPIVCIYWSSYINYMKWKLDNWSDIKCTYPYTLKGKEKVGKHGSEYLHTTLQRYMCSLFKYVHSTIFPFSIILYSLLKRCNSRVTSVAQFLLQKRSRGKLVNLSF